MDKGKGKEKSVLKMEDCLEGIWNMDLWTPSVPDTLSQKWTAMHPRKKNRLMLEVQKSAERLRTYPHSPEIWCKKGSDWIDFGFPELGAGDCYKAVLLCDAALKKDGENGPSLLGYQAWEEGGEIAWINKKQHFDKRDWTAIPEKDKDYFITKHMKEKRLDAYVLILTALEYMSDYAGMNQISWEALAKYPANDKIMLFVKRVDTAWSKKYTSTPTFEVCVLQEAGLKNSVLYPWLTPQLLTRSQALIDYANAEMNLASKGKLEIRDSGVGGQGCLGVFAKMNITSGDMVFDDLGPVNISCKQMDGKHCYNCFATLKPLTFVLKCCPMLIFCSLKCQQIYQDHYHKAICGKDFEYMYRETDNIVYQNTGHSAVPPFGNLLWLRMLVCCVSEGPDVHPLEGRVFGPLAAVHGQDTRWTMMGKVMMPFRILQNLGVDIFADPRWEQWVLEEMWSRLVANWVCEEGIFEPNLGRIYHWFNHTCELITMLGKARPPPPPQPSAPSFFTRFTPKKSSALGPNWVSVGNKGARKQLYAARDIKAGEEVFVSYDVFGPYVDKKLRSEGLEHWLGSGGVCGCSRCERDLLSEEMNKLKV